MLVVMLLFQFQVLLNAQNNDKSKDEYKFVIFSEFCFDQFFGDEDVSNECISDVQSSQQLLEVIFLALIAKFKHSLDLRTFLFFWTLIFQEFQKNIFSLIPQYIINKNQTISRTISILMVGFAVMNQVPQIYKILKSQSIQGISFNAYYTEVKNQIKKLVIFVFIYSELFWIIYITAYNLYKQTKFILYGENAIVGLEYCIVLCLFLFYDKILNFHQWLFKAVFFILINIPLYLGFGPQWIFDLTIYINMSLLFVARFLQIRLNCKNRNTGQLSLLTQLQNSAGSIARLFTLFNDNADFSYMIYVLEDNILGIVKDKIIFFFIIYKQGFIFQFISLIFTLKFFYFSQKVIHQSIASQKMEKKQKEVQQDLFWGVADSRKDLVQWILLYNLQHSHFLTVQQPNNYQIPIAPTQVVVFKGQQYFSCFLEFIVCYLLSLAKGILIKRISFLIDRLETKKQEFILYLSIFNSMRTRFLFNYLNVIDYLLNYTLQQDLQICQFQVEIGYDVSCKFQLTF